MILQSETFAENCGWFTTLVSRKEQLETICRQLKQVEAVEVKTLEMGQGNKVSGIVVSRF
jgi:23S rRNA (adenine1618-N6)-methyltransferase